MRTPSRYMALRWIQTQRVIELRNTATSHASNAEVRQHSAAAASESRAMVVIGEASRQDARAMKIVSIIALGYLPIGLVAVCAFVPDIVCLHGPGMTESYSN